MSESKPKLLGFACQQCRASKRRCDGVEPQCSYCKKTDKACVYAKEPKPRKRKYWDEAYVKSLENQVEALLALQNQSSTASRYDTSDLQKSGAGRSNNIHSIQQRERPSFEQQAQDGGGSSQSLQSMEELSVMMWRTNLADGVIINSEIDSKSTDTAANRNHQAPRFNTPRPISDYGEDPGRINILANLFLDCINEEHQFTQYETTAAFCTFPDHPPDLLFLHAAMLAAGATFENLPDSLELSDVFAELSESMIFTCFRHAPSIYVIQGLCVLSWRSLALAKDHLGWTFLSMAAGLAVHLRLHVLALDEIAAKSVKPSFETVRTFWSFYMTDRTAISILGRNCILPWRRVNVPAIESYFQDEKCDLSKISFAWQCKLWYMHDKNMDRIFSSSFEKQNVSDQVRMLISTHEDLCRFFKSRDERLKVTRGKASKPTLLFNMAYQMAILITMPPFLRLFASSKMEQNKISQAMSLVLRSITSAAASMIRLVQRYCKSYGFRHANPLLIHHILSASIVHLMNTTATSSSFRGHSTRLVRNCLSLLHGLSPYWPLRSQKSIDTIKALARRWNVAFVLLENDGDDQTQDLSACQVPNELKPFNPDVTSVTSANLDPSISGTAYEGLVERFDASYANEPIGEYFGDEQQYYDISMVNISISADDELFGLSQFFRNFENYTDLL